MPKIVSSFAGDPAQCLHTSQHTLYTSRLSIRRGQKALANSNTRITASQALLESSDALLLSIRKELIYSPSYLGAASSD